MRTTLNLDEDVARVAKAYAADRNLSLGAAVSILVKQGIAAPTPTRVLNGLTIFDPPSDSPVVTAQHVKDLMDSEF
jgi:D-alanyl-D-alanine carboxypeptidase